MPPKSRPLSKAAILKTITTPLGFYVLALLIVEGTLGLVLTGSKLSEEHLWAGFQWILILFGAVVMIVSVLAICCPKKLLYGKEEHLNPSLEPSALQDQIEDLIARNVRPECLKNRD